MSEWRRIDSIADVRRGASPRPIGDPKYFGGEVGWVRISDVTRASRFLRETEQYLSPTGEALSVRVNPGDLVMSICGTLGRPIMIDIAACIHDGFVQFTNLRNADTTYLFYALQFAESAFCGMGQPGTQTNLNTSLVGRHTIFCPSKSEQLRIAEILSTLDETIEQTETLIAKMQQVKSGLMHDLFTRGVSPDGRLRPTREQAPDLYKESPLGWVPKEWEPGILAQYLSPTDGLKPGPFGSSLTKDCFVPSGIKVYGQEQVIAGSLEIGDYYISQAKFLELSAFEVLVDDVLISLVGTVGCVIVAKSPFERGIINPRLMRLRPARGVVLPSFLKHLLLSANVQRQIDILAGGGTMPVINGKIIRRLTIPLLSYEEQLRVAERIDAIDMSLESVADELSKLHQQKHGLMHDLLTGSVRV
jgi:type I restriction enzyme S subunit